jgi:DUF1365 family protein
MQTNQPERTPGMQPEWPDSGAGILTGETFHGRRGGPENNFRYGVDFILVRVAPVSKHRSVILKRRRLALLGLCNQDHGRDGMAMAEWALSQAQALGMPDDAGTEIWLLTQPRILGFVFNPVSFWIFRDSKQRVRVVLAEVNNTFGDRHSYFCARPDFGPITDGDEIEAAKVFHVSPFQEVAGTYRFRFSFNRCAISISIDHQRNGHGVLATLQGLVAPMSERGLLRILRRYPLGALRVYGLIHWQALRLKLKGAAYRTRPAPPVDEVTR